MPNTKIYLKLKNWVLITIILLLLLSILIKILNSNLKQLTFDEIDYILATSPSFLELWLDNNSLGLFDYLELASSKINLVGNELQLPIEEETENFLRRHFHGPIPFYFLKVLGLLPYKEEALVAIGNLLLATILYFFLVGAVLKEKELSNRNFFSIFLVVITIIFTPAIQLASHTYNVHIFLGVCSLLSVSFYRLTENSGCELRYFGLGLFSSCLLLITVTGVVVTTLLLTHAFLNLEGNRLKKALVFFLIGILFGLLVMSPGYLWNGELFKSIGMYLYRIFWVKKEYALDKIQVVQFLQSFWGFLLLMLLAFLLGARRNVIRLKIVISGKKWRDCFRGAVNILKNCPVELFVGIGYLVFMSPFIINFTYLLPSLVLLVVWAVKRIADNLYQARARISRAFFVSLVFASIFSLNLQDMRSLVDRLDKFHVLTSSREQSYASTDYACKEILASNSQIVSFDSNALRLFTSNCRSSLSAVLDYDGARILIRKSWSYITLEMNEEQDRFVFLAKAARKRELEALRGLNFQFKSIPNSDWVLGYRLN